MSKSTIVLSTVLFIIMSSRCVPSVHASGDEPGCWPTDTPTPVVTNEPLPTATVIPTDTPVVPTVTPVPPTSTPAPTDTPIPTETPVPPTYTPAPTNTPTPTLTPIPTVPSYDLPTSTQRPTPAAITPTPLWTPVWTPHYTPELTTTPFTTYPPQPERTLIIGTPVTNETPEPTRKGPFNPDPVVSPTPTDQLPTPFALPPTGIVPSVSEEESVTTWAAGLFLLGLMVFAVRVLVNILKGTK